MRWAFGCVAALASMGCSGLRFGNSSLNESLPEDWKNRNFYHNTAIFKRNLAELAGSVLHKSSQDPDYLRVGRLLKKDYVPSLQVIDDGMVFESKVDRGASIQGAYLAWTANLRENQKAGVIIQDVSQVFIRSEDLPWEDLAKIATQATQDATVKRYYVQGALLSSMVITRYLEIEADASGVIGDTFGIGGKAFTREGQVSRDFRIALELIDLELLRRQIAADEERVPETKDNPKLWAERCLKELDSEAYLRKVADLKCKRLDLYKIKID